VKPSSDHAIRPLAIGERRLELVGGGRQRVAHDRLHAALAEGAARLLVGEDVLERQHLARETGQVLLRRVDHGEALVELRQVLDRLLHVLLEVVPHAVLQAVEALGDQPNEISLARAEDLADRLHAAGHLGLLAGDGRHLLLDLALALDRGGGLDGAAARGAPGGQGEQDQHEHRRGEQAEHGLAPGDRATGDDEDDSIHASRLAGFACANKSGTCLISGGRRIICVPPWPSDPFSCCRMPGCASSPARSRRSIRAC
jgi:hypothetical protein